MKTCHRCGSEWESPNRQPGFKEICVRCDAYLHCCKNCKHHRISAPNQCYIPNTEAIGDRAGMNFCEEFEFKDPAREQDGADKAKDARQELENLLGPLEKKALDPDFLGGASKKPKSLDDLFGDK